MLKNFISGIYTPLAFFLHVRFQNSCKKDRGIFPYAMKPKLLNLLNVYFLVKIHIVVVYRTKTLSTSMETVTNLNFPCYILMATRSKPQAIMPCKSLRFPKKKSGAVRALFKNLKLLNN